MKPFEVRFYLYASDEREVEELQRALYDLVDNCYRDEIYVSASKLSKIIHQVFNNPILKNYLK